MPVVYRCKVCGFILDVFVKVGQNSRGVLTPSELISQYGGMCPRCGHRLEPPTLSDIIVKPNGAEELLAVIEEARQTMGIQFRSIQPLLEELRLAVARTQTPTTLATQKHGPGLALSEA